MRGGAAQARFRPDRSPPGACACSPPDAAAGARPCFRAPGHACPWWPRNKEGQQVHGQALVVKGSGPLCARVQGQRRTPCSGWAAPRRSSRPWARGRLGRKRTGAQRPRSSGPRCPRTRGQSPPWSCAGGVRSRRWTAGGRGRGGLRAAGAGRGGSSGWSRRRRWSPGWKTGGLRALRLPSAPKAQLLVRGKNYPG